MYIASREIGNVVMIVPQRQKYSAEIRSSSRDSTNGTEQKFKIQGTSTWCVDAVDGVVPLKVNSGRLAGSQSVAIA